MKKYQKSNRRYFIGALVSVLISTVFAVVLQFFKGDVLDCAAAGEVQKTVYYAGLLFGFILCEVFGYFLYDWFRVKFIAGCAGALKQDIFESIIKRNYADFVFVLLHCFSVCNMACFERRFFCCYQFEIKLF